MNSHMQTGWQVLPVRALIERHFTGPSPTCEERNIASTGEWGILKTTAITWNGWNDRAHKVPPRRYWGQSSIEVQRDDVLITKAGPRHRVGVVVHVKQTEPHLMVSGKMIALRPKQSLVLPPILAAILSAEECQAYLNTRTTGMAESQTNFSDRALLDMLVSVPPLEDQYRIAQILDALDSQIAASARVFAKLELVKTGMLSDFIEAIPIGRYERLASLCVEDICYGIVQPGSFVPDGIPVLAIRDLLGDFQTGVHRASHSIDQQYRRSRVRPGDVLLSIKGTIGRVAVVPEHFEGNISRDMARLRFGREIEPDFAQIYFSSEHGQRMLDLAVVGTTRAEVSIHTLKRLTFPVLPQEVQKTFKVSIRTLDRARTSESETISKLCALRQGMVANLLTAPTTERVTVAS
jgi:type I restriction enzyme, S subunit